MEGTRYELVRARLDALAGELGVELRLGYIGNLSGSRDDRSWDVCIGSAVPRAHTDGRGPWSHRASGFSFPSTPAWSTAEFPSADEVEAMVRDRLAREVASDAR